MKKILAVALVLVFALTVFASCGGGGVAGTYKLKSMMGMEISALAALYGGDASEIEDMMSLVLKEDGTGSIVSDGDTSSFTWTQSGNTLTMTVDGESQDCTISGNEITMSQDGVEVVFVKK